MDDVDHEGNGTQIDVLGYRTCRNPACAELILVEIAERTTGLCPPCWRERRRDLLTDVVVRVRGRRMRMPAPAGRRKEGRGNQWTAKQAAKARDRARRRLALIFPELFDMLVAEERERVGLDPIPVDTAITERAGMDADETMDFAAVYHALTEHGVDVDGPQDT